MIRPLGNFTEVYENISHMRKQCIPGTLLPWEGPGMGLALSVVKQSSVKSSMYTLYVVSEMTLTACVAYNFNQGKPFPQ